MIKSASPDISQQEVDAVTQALSSGTLSTGEIVEKFENEFADFSEQKMGVAVCSGSVALELALEVSDFQKGDGVIVSPRNCAAVLYPILRQGLVPIFVDVVPNGVNIDPDAVQQILETKPDSVSAILTTHLHGSSCKISELQTLSSTYDVRLIEDICQSPGAEKNGRKVGSFGSLAICSFGATKPITTAEGGIIIGSDEEEINRLRQLRSSRNGESAVPLRSVRMSDIEAAMGRRQLSRYEELVSKRRELADIYTQELPGTVTIPYWNVDSTHVYLNFPIFVDQPNDLVEYLYQKDIEASSIDKLLNEYECLSSPTDREFPHAHRHVEETAILPLHTKLSKTDVLRVVDEVKNFKQHEVK